MALTATIYNLDTELAHVDRGVYATFRLKLARQPSETLEYMLTRYLAYCLEHTEGITLTEGIAAGAEPAGLVRGLTGRGTAGVGGGGPGVQQDQPSSKLAGRGAGETHRERAPVRTQRHAKGM